MHLADDPVVSPEIIKTANYGCWASACRYVFRQITAAGNDSNLLIVFYVQIMPDDLVMQLHRF